MATSSAHPSPPSLFHHPLPTAPTPRPSLPLRTDKQRANFYRETWTCCCGPFVLEKFSKHNCKVWGSGFRGCTVGGLGGMKSRALGLSGSESLRCLFVLRTFSAPMHTLQIHLVSLGCFVSLFLRLLFSWLSDLSSSSSLCCRLKFWVLISLSGYVHRVSITKNQYTTFTPQSRLNSHRFVQVNHQRRHFKLY